MEFNHIPVLFNETIESLNIKPNGVYIDCTAGGGGHSSAISERLSENGKLLCIDRDPDAIENLKNRFSGNGSVQIIHGNFADIRSIADSAGISGADGILADLGVSSFQLDNAERGFSYRVSANLDMRMSKEGKSAYDVVNTYSESDLRRILFTYGEEKFSSSIAKRIVAEREKKPIEDTLELAEIIKSGIPARARRDGGHPAKRSFQAIRIEVNGELENLAGNIEDMFSVLNVGGVLSVITFHSLEDRAVKQTFKKLATGCVCPPDFPVCVCGKTPEGKILLKGLSPTSEELEKNSRAHSARLRSIIRLK